MRLLLLLLLLVDLAGHMHPRCKVLVGSCSCMEGGLGR